MKIWAIIRKAAYLLVMIFILVVLAVLKNNVEMAEYMTTGSMRAYGQTMAMFSSFIPFLSLTEVVVLAIAICCLVLLILAIIDFFKIRWFKAINKLLAIPCIILTIVALYNFSCEAAYNRKSMPLPYYEEEVARDDFSKIYNYFANDLDSCVDQVTFKENGDVEGMKLSDIANDLKEAYKILDSNDYFHSHFGSVKPMASSFIYRELQITGVTFSPFAEANINTMNTNVNIPFTTAHELAHTKGVMREDDANQLAFYVCINSDKPYLRYSAYVSYFYQLRSMCSSSYLTDEQLSNINPISDQYRQYAKTVNYVHDFWEKHDLLGDIGEWFNNLYIKSSGVQEGTSSYHGGTDYEFDPTTNKFYPSMYQKLFIEKYYRENPSA